MEVLTLLEERVLNLIDETEHLRREYRRMLKDVSDQMAEIQTLQEENRILKETVQEEQQMRAFVLQRVDALLQRLSDLDKT